MSWRETVRDTLVGDCPPADDVDLPGDGAQRAVGLRLLALSAALVFALAALAVLVLAP